MRKVEFILCFENHTWDTEVIPDVPEELSTNDSLVEWANETRFNDYDKLVFVGVYSLNPE